MAGGSTIAQILLDQLRVKLRSQRELSTHELAVRAAVETAPPDRAWALVTFAARLREEGDTAGAWMAINAAVALDAGDEPTRGAYVCAIALHADSGDLGAAIRVGEELLSSGSEKHLLNAMARVYWEQWQATHDESARLKWQQMSKLVDADLAQTASGAKSDTQSRGM
jgi:hypothetical protein